MDKVKESTDYNAVIKQFDDLISELSNSGYNVKDSLKQSNSLHDIIQDTSCKNEESIQDVGKIKNSLNDSKCNQKKIYLFETNKNNILSRDETEPGANIQISKDEHIKSDSSNLTNHNVIKKQLSNAVETIPWIDSQLWHAESKAHANPPQKPTLYKMKQSSPIVNDLIHPKENKPIIVSSMKNISDHGSLNYNKSYPIPAMDYPSRYKSKYNMRHVPSVLHSEVHGEPSVYSPSFAFQREKTAKGNFWIPGASVEKSPRLGRSSASKYNYSEKCFWVNLFIETKNSHLGPFTFEIYSRMSLRLLKLKVEKEYGIVSSSQRWILGRNFAVDNDKSLVDYNVMPESPIILYVDSKCDSSTKKNEFSTMKSVPIGNNYETNILDKDKGINLSDNQGIKSKCGEADICIKKQNLDLTSSCHDLYSERGESNKPLYVSMPNVTESPSVKKKIFNRALKSKNTLEMHDTTSETNVAYEDKDANMSSFQANQFMCNEAEVSSRKNSSDLKNCEIDFISAPRVSYHDLLSESKEMNPVIYYDCVSDIIQSQSVINDNCNRYLQSKEIEYKIYAENDLNFNVGKTVAEPRNIVYEQNSNIEKNVDTFKSTETTSDRDGSATSSSGQMKPFVENSTMLAAPSHAEYVLQNKDPKAVLKNEVFNLLHVVPYPTKGNSSSCESKDINLINLSKNALPNINFEVYNKKNFQSSIVPEIFDNKKEVFFQNEQTHEIECINNYDEDNKSIEIKNLCHLNKTEDVEQPDLTKNEQSDNLHFEANVQHISNSKRSRTSFLRKLCLTRKTQSTEDSSADFSTITTEMADKKSCDHSTSHVDRKLSVY